jgi:hypothetical protein
MDRRSSIAAAALWLAPLVAFSHTIAFEGGRGFAVGRAPTAAPSVRPTSGAKADNLWTCWYDGAPVQRLPLPTPKVTSQTARAGQVFAAETVEVSPFGMEWIRLRSRVTGDTLWVPLAYCRRVAPENAASGNLPIGRERLGRYDGLLADYRPTDLVSLPSRYRYNDEAQLLRAEAAQACVQMLNAAHREAGLTINVLSAYRSLRTQAWLCRRKIESAGIEQRLVARPGHSEHQLGTTVDLVGDEGLDLLNERFSMTPEGRWLSSNCRRFGFVQTYARRRTPSDATPCEPWHFRYVGRANVDRFTTNEGMMKDEG